MTFTKICPICNKEFVTITRGRGNCYICQPFNVSAKGKQINNIIPEKEQSGKTVEEILEEAKEKGTV